MSQRYSTLKSASQKGHAHIHTFTYIHTNTHMNMHQRKAKKNLILGVGDMTILNREGLQREDDP